MKKFFAVAVLVMILVFCAPAIIGIRAEARYQLAIDRIQQSGLAVISRSYNLGWFGSTAKTGIVFVGAKGSSADKKTDTLHLTLLSTISHGPLVSSGFGLAEISSEIEFPEHWIPLPDYPAQIHTLVDFDGRGHTRINLPAADIAGSVQLPDISFGGVTGEIDFDIAGNIEIHLILHSLGVGNAGKKLIELGETRLDSKSHLGDSGLMLGSGELKVQRLILHDQGQNEQFAVRELAVDLESSEEAEQVRAVASYRLERIEAGGAVYGPGLLRVELSRLSAPVLVRLQQAMEEIKNQAMSDAQRGMAMMGIVMGVGSELLKNDPAIAIKPLRLITPDGTVEGEISLRAEGLSLAELSNMRALAGKLVADLSLRMPEKLFRTMLIQQTRLQVERKISTMIEQGAEAPALEPGQLQQLVERQVDEQLSHWLSQQIIERDGEDLATVASLSSGLLTVNGKTIPLPQ